MSELPPTYHVSVRPLKGNAPIADVLPLWTMKLAYRLLQVASQPGEYTFRLVIHEDGLKELEVIQPPKAERLGY